MYFLLKFTNHHFSSPCWSLYPFFVQLESYEWVIFLVKCMVTYLSLSKVNSRCCQTGGPLGRSSGNYQNPLCGYTRSLTVYGVCHLKTSDNLHTSRDLMLEWSPCLCPHKIENALRGWIVFHSYSWLRSVGNIIMLLIQRWQRQLFLPSVPHAELAHTKWFQSGGDGRKVLLW